MKKFLLLYILLARSIYSFPQANQDSLFHPSQKNYLRFNGGELLLTPEELTFESLDTAFTISAWIYPEPKNAELHYRECIFSQIPATTSDPYAFISSLRVEDDHTVRFSYAYDSASSITVFSKDSVSDFHWNHVTCRLGNGKMSLWINGKKSVESVCPSGNYKVPLRYYIGGIKGGPPNNHVEQGFIGLISSVSVWDIALADTLIEHIAENAPSGTEPGIQEYWPLDEDSGQYATNHADPSGKLMLGLTEQPEHEMFAATSADPVWVNSKFIDGGPYFRIKEYKFEGNIQAGALIDFDHDGDLDFICTVEAGEWLCRFAAFKNDGHGNFSDATNEILPVQPPAFHGGANQFLVKDFNGDGLQDVFLGCFGIDAEPFGGENNFLLLQSADGKLIDVSSTHLPPFHLITHAETAGDIDGDGDIDIFVVEWRGDQDFGFYINDGTGKFTLDNTRVPYELNHPGSLSYKLVDVDNDGDPDLYGGAIMKAEGDIGFLQTRGFLVLNDGTGYFQYADSTALPIKPYPDFRSCNQPDQSIADLNLDGFPDILDGMTNGDTAGSQSAIRLLYSNGNGTYKDFTYKLPITLGTACPYTADFNNDGYEDIVVKASAEPQRIKIFLNNANFEFVDATALLPMLHDPDTYAYPGDLDNDGDIDMVIIKSIFITAENLKNFPLSDNFPLKIPGKIRIISPETDDNVSAFPQLNWQPDNLAITYELQLNTDSLFTSPYLDTTAITETFFKPPKLTVNTKYFWRVRASNPYGSGPWSDMYSFTAINYSPSKISLKSKVIFPQTRSGHVAGILQTDDPDSWDTHTYKLVNDNSVNARDNSYFKISGDTLITITSIDKSKTDSINILVKATDPYGADVQQSLHLALNSLDYLAYYPFNGNADDESGHGLNGIVTGATLTADRDGVRKSAYSFNGVSDYITVPSPVIGNRNSFTLLAWINPDQLSPGESRQYSLFCERISGESMQWAVMGNNQCFSFWNDGNENSDLDNEALVAHAWQFISMSFDGFKIRYYLNGKKTSEYDRNGTPDGTAAESTIATWDKSSGFFNGSMDDIRIIGRALSDEEIAYFYDEKTSVIMALPEKACGMDIKIYPNPSSGIFRIRLESENNNLIKADCYNISGSRVSGTIIFTDHNGDIIVDLSGYPPGVYLVRIESRSFTRIVKVVKK